MRVLGEADIRSGLAMLSEGEEIAFGGTVRPCTFDERDEVIEPALGGAAQIHRVITALFRTADFPDIKAGDTVTCFMADNRGAGIEYEVRTTELLGDRGLTRLVLRRDP